MKLSEFKNYLKNVDEINFINYDGVPIPKHFHITEVGQINKKYIDCGGTIRNESVVSMQLWESIDLWHRLSPTKLLSIIDLSEEKLGIQDNEIEIEYQAETIGKFTLDFKNNEFILNKTHTDCLASDKCGIPLVKVISETIQGKCTPGSGCC